MPWLAFHSLPLSSLPFYSPFLCSLFFHYFPSLPFLAFPRLSRLSCFRMWYKSFMFSPVVVVLVEVVLVMVVIMVLVMVVVITMMVLQPTQVQQLT